MTIELRNMILEGFPDTAHPKVIILHLGEPIDCIVLKKIHHFSSIGGFWGNNHLKIQVKTEIPVTTTSEFVVEEKICREGVYSSFIWTNELPMEICKKIGVSASKRRGQLDFWEGTFSSIHPNSWDRLWRDMVGLIICIPSRNTPSNNLEPATINANSSYRIDQISVSGSGLKTNPLNQQRSPEIQEDNNPMSWEVIANQSSLSFVPLPWQIQLTQVLNQIREYQYRFLAVADFPIQTIYNTQDREIVEEIEKNKRMARSIESSAQFASLLFLDQQQKHSANTGNITANSLLASFNLEPFLDAIASYQQRRKYSRITLFKLSSSLLLMVVALVGILAALLLFRQSVPNPIYEKISILQSRKSQSFTGYSRQDLLDWKTLGQGEAYQQLENNTQRQIEEQIEEIEEYLLLREKLLTQGNLLRIHQRDQLDKLLESLQTTLVVPQKYSLAWAGTEVVKWRENLIQEISQMRVAVEQLYNYLEVQIKEARELVIALPLDRSWRDREKHFWKKQVSPFSESDKKLGRAYQFDECRNSQNTLQKYMQQLQLLTNFVQAFALDTNGKGGLEPASKTVNSAKQGAVFVVDYAAITSGNTTKTLFEIQDRLQRLSVLYPNYSTWNIEQLPENRRMLIRQAIWRQIRNADQIGGWLLRDYLKRNSLTEQFLLTESNRLKLAKWFESENQLRIWVEWQRILYHLYDRKWEDPLTTILNFLRTNSFDLNLTALDLVIPAELITDYHPDGRLKLNWQGKGQSGVDFFFSQEGDPIIKEGAFLRYHFILDQRSMKLAYAPGDSLQVHLAFKNRLLEENAIWKCQTSQAYQFQMFWELQPLEFHSEKNKISKKGTIRLEPFKGQIPRMPMILEFGFSSKDSK